MLNGKPWLAEVDPTKVTTNLEIKAAKLSLPLFLMRTLRYVIAKILRA